MPRLLLASAVLLVLAVLAAGAGAIETRVLILLHYPAPVPIHWIAGRDNLIAVGAGVVGEASRGTSFVGYYEPGGEWWWASLNGSVLSVYAREGLVAAGASLSDGRAAVLLGYPPSGGAEVLVFRDGSEPLLGGIRGVTVVGDSLVVAGNVAPGNPYMVRGLVAVLGLDGSPRRAYWLDSVAVRGLAACGDRYVVVGEEGGRIVLILQGPEGPDKKVTLSTPQGVLSPIAAQSSRKEVAVSALLIGSDGTPRPALIVYQCSSGEVHGLVLDAGQGRLATPQPPAFDRDKILLPLAIYDPATQETSMLLARADPASGSVEPLLTVRGRNTTILPGGVARLDGSLAVSGGIARDGGEDGFIAIIPYRTGGVLEDDNITITLGATLTIGSSRLQLGAENQSFSPVEESLAVDKLAPGQEAPEIETIMLISKSEGGLSSLMSLITVETNSGPATIQPSPGPREVRESERLVQMVLLIALAVLVASLLVFAHAVLSEE